MDSKQARCLYACMRVCVYVCVCVYVYVCMYVCRYVYIYTSGAIPHHHAPGSKPVMYNAAPRPIDQNAIAAPGRDQNIDDKTHKKHNIHKTEKTHTTHKKHNTDNTGKTHKTHKKKMLSDTLDSSN